MNEDCLKLTVYFGERDRAGEAFLADALLDLFARHSFEASVLLRGAEGFGAKQRLQTQRLLSCRRTCPWWPWRWTRASASSTCCPS